MSNKRNAVIYDNEFNTEVSNILLSSLQSFGIANSWWDFTDNGIQVKKALIKLYDTAKEGDILSMVSNFILWEYPIRDLLLPTLNISSKTRLMTFFAIQSGVYRVSMCKPRSEALKYIKIQLD